MQPDERLKTEWMMADLNTYKVLPKNRTQWAVKGVDTRKATQLHNSPVVLTKGPTTLFDAIKGCVAWKKVQSLVFWTNPSEAIPPGCLNMFSAVGISAEDVQTISIAKAFQHSQNMLYHLFERWTRRSSADYGYLLKFFAHMVQLPGQQIERLVSLVSAQGAGKGCVVQQLMTILGRWNCITIPKKEYLCGDFNGAVAFKTFAFLDEQQWKQTDPDREYLKTVITDHTITINEKHKPRVTIPNTLNLIQASQQFSHLEPKERRTFMLVLVDELSGSADRIKDAALTELWNTTPRMFARVLHAISLEGFAGKGRLAPSTLALVQGQLKSAEAPKRFIYDHIIQESNWVFVNESTILPPLLSELLQEYKATYGNVYLKDFLSLLGEFWDHMMHGVNFKARRCIGNIV